MRLSKTQAKLRATILDKIYAKGPISRVDIAKETGITPATTSSITGELIQEGLLYELGEDETDTSVGRKKILLDIQARRYFFIGCELSEKHFTFSLGDNLGNILKEEKHLVHKKDIAEQGADKIITSLQAFITNHVDVPLTAIGMALPGRYLDDKKITTNNPLWQEIDLAALEREFELPIFFSNNVNCMALGKRLFDRKQADENFVYFHFARGMHCSYIYKGEIYGKGNLVIGEIGHTVVASDGALCGCGRKGCLQTFASEAWLIKKAQLLYQNAPNSLLPSLVSRIEDISISTLLTAYQLGDLGVLALIKQALTYLSQSILNLSMMIDAHKIYLHSPLLTDQTIISELYQEMNYKPQLLYNRLPEVTVEVYDDFTGSRAAIALAVQETLLKQAH